MSANQKKRGYISERNSSGEQKKKKKRAFLTLMAIEDLHDFPTLQIPQIDFAIFAARHDPLASGDAEAGADAVLGVLVADVRL